MVRKFWGKAQFQQSFGRFARNSAKTVFPQNFHTRKLGEILVFYAVEPLMKTSWKQLETGSWKQDLTEKISQIDYIRSSVDLIVKFTKTRKFDKKHNIYTKFVSLVY